MRLWLVIFLGGCIHLAPLRDHRLRAVLLAPAAECDALDRKVAALSVSSVVFGSLGAGAGIGSFLPLVANNDAAKWSVAAGGVVSTALSTGLGWGANFNSAKYSKRCTINVGGSTGTGAP